MLFSAFYHANIQKQSIIKINVYQISRHIRISIHFKRIENFTHFFDRDFSITHIVHKLHISDLGVKTNIDILLN